MEGPTPPQPPREQALTELKKAGFRPARLADSKGEQKFTYSTGRGKEKVVKTMAHQEIRKMMVDQALEDIVAQKFERQRTPSELKELCVEIGDEVTKIKEALKEGNREALQGILGREDLKDQVDRVKAEYLGRAEAMVSHKIDVSKGYSERGVLNYELRQRYKSEIGGVEAQYADKIKNIPNYGGTPKERLQQVLESGVLSDVEAFKLRASIVSWGENDLKEKYKGNRFAETYGQNLRKSWGLSRASQGPEGGEPTTTEEVQTPKVERVSEEIADGRYAEILKAVESLVPEGKREDITQIAAGILQKDLRHDYSEFNRISLERPDSSIASFIQGGSIEGILDSTLSQHDRKLIWRTDFCADLRRKVKAIHEEAESFGPRVQEASTMRDKIGKVFNSRPEYNRVVEGRVESAAKGKLEGDEARVLFDQQVKARMDQLKQIREKLENDKNYDKIGATFGLGGEKVLKEGILTPDDLWALEQSQELWIKSGEMRFQVQSPLSYSNFSLLGLHGEENIKYDLSEFVMKNKLEGVNPEDLDAPLDLSSHVKLSHIPTYGTIRLKEQGKYTADTLETRKKLEKALSEAAEVGITTGNKYTWEDYVRRNAHQMLPQAYLQELYRRSFAEHPGSAMVVKLAEFAQNLHMEELRAFDRANAEEGQFLESIGSTAGSRVLLGGDNYTLDYIMKAQLDAARAKFKAAIAEMPLETRLAAVGFSDLPAESAQGFVDNLSVLSEFVRKNAPGSTRRDTAFIAGPLPFLDRTLRSIDQVFSTELPSNGTFMIVDVKPEYQRSLDKVYMTAYLSTRVAKVEDGNVAILTTGDGQIPSETEKEFVDDGKHLFLAVPEGFRAAA